MIRIIVHQHSGQDGWYIREESDVCVDEGKIRYNTREEACRAARKKYPYVGVCVED